MRLFAKFFICGTLVISIALLLSGYLLISFSHESAINRELDRAITQFQFDKFTIQSRLITSRGDLGYSANALSRWSLELNGGAAFFCEDKNLLYSNLPEFDFSVLDNISDTIHVHQLKAFGGESYIIIGGRFTQSDTMLHLLVATNISDVVAQREQMVQNFIQVYFIALLAGMLVITLLSALITRPIVRMNKTATEIAKGHYNQRIPFVGSDEIGELSNSFNIMANAIEDKIYELLINAQQKEDFVASFAHELKTPLTSVIGYADMLYQKEFTPKQIKSAAGYILDEGLRLEALSLKLMDLIVLNRQDFVLEAISANDLIANIVGGLQPLINEKNVVVETDVQADYIMVEYDLIKTLLLNLIDNAIKASSKLIKIIGSQTSEKYRLSVIDNGRGMPTEELFRITEAFYTVDKSRSRKEHGAGIGLALAARIAEIHGSKLEFSSSVGVGTTVSLDLDM